MWIILSIDSRFVGTKWFSMIPLLLQNKIDRTFPAFFESLPLTCDGELECFQTALYCLLSDSKQWNQLLSHVTKLSRNKFPSFEYFWNNYCHIFTQSPVCSGVTKHIWLKHISFSIYLTKSLEPCYKWCQSSLLHVWQWFACLTSRSLQQQNQTFQSLRLSFVCYASHLSLFSSLPYNEETAYGLYFGKV